jgi:hypothetical protein
MAIKRDEGRMPAEQGGRERGGMMDDRERGNDEDIRGIGESDESDDEFEDTEDIEDTEDEEEEGSF